jgi:coenzyme PQQ precursor peptide PqqA
MTASAAPYPRCPYNAPSIPLAAPAAWLYPWQAEVAPVQGGSALAQNKRGNDMAWTTPTLVEICIGLEINGYLPAEF